MTITDSHIRCNNIEGSLSLRKYNAHLNAETERLGFASKQGKSILLARMSRPALERGLSSGVKRPRREDNRPVYCPPDTKDCSSESNEDTA